MDDQHKLRMESFEVKMKPIIIRDGPSRKANFKIQAAKLQYEIYSLTQRLRYTNFRAENEEKVRSLGKNAMAFGYCYVIIYL